MESLLRDVARTLRAEARPRDRETILWFHPSRRVECLGISTPRLRAILRGYRDRIRALDLRARLDLALRLLESGVLEDAHAGIHVLILSLPELGPAHLPHLDRCVRRFRSWTEVDDFGVGVLGPLLLRHPRPVLARIRAWSRSRHLWSRRTAAVAFVRKVGASGRFVEEALDVAGRLAFDDEDLVRKAAGWALKDTMRGAKPRVLAFVKDLRRRGAPAVVTLYAIRDLPPAERAAVLRVKPLPVASRRGP